jgi:hypothetical protein
MFNFVSYGVWEAGYSNGYLFIKFGQNKDIGIYMLSYQIKQMKCIFMRGLQISCSLRFWAKFDDRFNSAQASGRYGIARTTGAVRQEHHCAVWQSTEIK